MRDDDNISIKTNRVLNLFLLALILIFIRVWFLSVIQRDDQLEMSHRPRRRSSIEKTERGTIRDRYNTPLAENKMHYNVAISYSDIKEVPSFVWQTNEEGKRVKIYKRKEHITKIAEQLSSELGLNAEEIEDSIYGKAALFPQLPLIIKEDITEEQYYKFKMLEKELSGIRAQKAYKRVYPLGKTGCEVIGYMGSISEREYKQIVSQIAELEHYIEERENGNTPMLPKGFSDPNAVRAHLKYLKERAYTLQDFIGKSGIEAKFDKELRGVYGKSYFEIDNKGNIIRKLPGSKDPSSARRIVLTISAELQEFAEKLLAERERQRGASFNLKGGAIVAMDPHNGEILALASYPRFSPQDFIPGFTSEEKINKSKSIARWLETENYLGMIWDGARRLEKEVYDDTKGFYELSKTLTWSYYLKLILSEKSAIYKVLQEIKTIRGAWDLQDTFKKLQELLGYKEPKEIMLLLYSNPSYTLVDESNIDEYRSLKKQLDFYLNSIPNNTDKLLAIDLVQLLICKDKMGEEEVENFGDITLNDYNAHRQIVVSIEKGLESKAREYFHKTRFSYWRKENFKEFLKSKRKEEEAKSTYAKPYTDYLESEEKRQFQSFWKENNQALLCSFLFDDFLINESLKDFLPFIKMLQKDEWQKDKVIYLNQAIEAFTTSEKLQYINTMKSFSALNAPLLCKYRNLRNQNGKQLQKHLASAFYPISGYGYVRSSAFRQALPQGSVFKLVVAYEALKEKFEYLKNEHEANFSLNPLTLVDELKWSGTNQSSQILGYTLDGDAITRVYKGGKLPRSSHAGIGKVDLVGAIEQSSNIYFSLLASEHIRNPSDLLETARKMGYGVRSGLDLPGEIEGKLPNDVNYNKTGLYAFAIGQHSLVVTPVQTAIMMSSIANQGKVLKPQIVKIVAAKEKNEEKSPFDHLQNFAFEEPLSLLGIYFPVFTEALPPSSENVFQVKGEEIKENLDFPKPIRNLLLKGMQNVMIGPKGTARASAIRNLCKNEKVFRDYIDLQEELVGKTGTAELLLLSTIDSESKAQIQNHVWFAGIAFENKYGNIEKWDNPELVIVVYLPNGQYGGKEAAPLAAQMVKKWREIKKKNDDFGSN